MRNGEILKVLHVLTLDDGHGEYGGPVSVAKQLCRFLNDNERFSSEIISGTRRELGNINNSEDKIERIFVKAIISSFPISSLFSIRMGYQLFFRIKKVRVVHIHAGRDIISIFAAYCAILMFKPYFIQTHGMIKCDDRIITKLFDFLFTKRILKKANKVFYLNDNEFKELKEAFQINNLYLLENGIQKQSKAMISTHSKRVLFCSRLHPNKNIEFFMDVVDEMLLMRKDLQYEIYGPDGGQLPLLLERLRNPKYFGYVKYLGFLKNEEVISVLRNASCLILPSIYDPFPMVILESLSVGTPVLISSACGQSKKISQFQEGFVCQLQNPKLYAMQLNQILEQDSENFREEIMDFCESEFGITKVLATLEQYYLSTQF